jgi:hypothetical protein
MKKTHVVLILLALLIAGTYWYFKTDWLRPGTVQIVVRTMPTRTSAARPGIRTGRGTTNAPVAARGAASKRGQPAAGRRGSSTAATAQALEADPPVLFDFDRKLAFTSIEIFPVSELETNAQLPHPVWHLIAGTNPVPTKGFTYGQNPATLGMRQAVIGVDADPLEPGVKYRLFIEAGPIKAQRDFTPP